MSNKITADEATGLVEKAKKSQELDDPEAARKEIKNNNLEEQMWDKISEDAGRQDNCTLLSNPNRAVCDQLAELAENEGFTCSVSWYVPEQIYNLFIRWNTG